MLLSRRWRRLYYFLLEFFFLDLQLGGEYGLSPLRSDVRASQSEMETTFNDAQEGIESAASKLYSKDPARAKEFLTNYTNMTAQSTLDTWKRLGEFLIVKYNDGVVKRMKDGKFERNSIGQPAGVIRPGYPKEFLEEYVKQTGDRYKMPE
mgnify:CR=1 FL=1